ncbi:MAG: carboxypeptidase regulatory-like domain-containing protein, partial [Planctomycetes bacterium]|nr:carboxypeptidase regulatory-like domain-containing protein [Planctomycetota bacterium]
MRLARVLVIAAAMVPFARGADPEPGIAIAAGHRGIRVVSCGHTFRATLPRIAEIRLPVRSYDREPFFLRATVHETGSGGRLLAARAIRLSDRYDFASAVFRFAPEAIPLRRDHEYRVHIERCGGDVFEVRGAAGATDPGEIAIEISPAATPEVVERPWASEGEPRPGTGVLAGSTGGNERDCVLFARDAGEIRMRHTAPDGLFRFDGVPPGEYMCLSSGRVAARIRVRAGETTTLDWGPFDAYDLGAETWSPARTTFGQTFVATGRSLLGISFWIPGEPVRLE